MGSLSIYLQVFSLTFYLILIFLFLFLDRAQQAMISVDPIFARKYTALAVTQGFQGSPHIDKQNVGPFYGLALGNFDEGTGGIRVECSARVVGKSFSFLLRNLGVVQSSLCVSHLVCVLLIVLAATVNTKNRLGKVDGRHPHWVAPYDLDKERYSLIYYQTTGEMEAVGPAIFTTPTVPE